MGTALLGALGLDFSAAGAPQGVKGARSRLAIITDEISQDPEVALDFIASYSLGGCELRQFWDKNIMNLSAGERARLKKMIAARGLKVVGIASPLYKYNLPEMPAQENEKRDTFRASFTEQDTESLLQQSFELARFFGTTLVRIFSYWRVDDPQKAFPYVRDRLIRAAKAARKNNIVLALENEPTCNVGTSRELGRMVREIGSTHLRATWDPGNAAIMGEVPFPDGYREVRGLFEHMHVKDVRPDPATGESVLVPVGSGVVDYRGQFRAVQKDGYQGAVSLETHYRRPDGNVLESTREALEGLLKILKEVGWGESSP